MHPFSVQYINFTVNYNNLNKPVYTKSTYVYISNSIFKRIIWNRNVFLDDNNKTINFKILCAKRPDHYQFKKKKAIGCL